MTTTLLSTQPAMSRSQRSRSKTALPGIPTCHASSSAALKQTTNSVPRRARRSARSPNTRQRSTSMRRCATGPPAARSITRRRRLHAGVSHPEVWSGEKGDRTVRARGTWVTLQPHSSRGARCSGGGRYSSINSGPADRTRRQRSRCDRAGHPARHATRSPRDDDWCSRAIAVTRLMNQPPLSIWMATSATPDM